MPVGPDVVLTISVFLLEQKCRMIPNDSGKRIKNAQ